MNRSLTAATFSTVIFVAAAFLTAKASAQGNPPEQTRSARLWHDATILIAKGGDVELNQDGIRMLNCTLHNPAGVPIGSYTTPVNPFDLATTITFQTDGGTISGTFGSVLNDGVFPDGVYEVLNDVDGKQYFVFEGTTLVGGAGDWVGTGQYQDVKKIIWRCKFELDSAGNLVACLYCVYTFVY